MAYDQYCSVARTLDVVGDRWTLLMVRELLVGPARFTDLKAGLPGIASNLLSGRLKALQRDGVIERRLAPDGVVYALTPWGEGLREPLEGLARWGAPLMRRGRGTDAFRPHWLVVALEGLLRGTTAPRTNRIGLRVDGEVLGVTLDAAGARAEVGAEGPFDAELVADGQTVLALASGAWTLDEAIARGADATGDRSVLQGFRRIEG